VRVIHVVRKPLSESSVAANVLKHGTGALNIDGTRIAAPGETVTTKRQGKESVVREDKVYGKFAGWEEESQSDGQKIGRWPANLILEHKPGCRRRGTRQVKASNQPGKGHGKKGDINSGIGFGGAGKAEGKSRQAPFYTDPDSYGRETVEAWDCEPGCPVADLDAQSGELISGKPCGLRHAASATFGQVRGNDAPLTGYGDKGGASRFFKQVK